MVSSPTDESVSQFVELTGCPVEQARFYLEATEGHYERAVAMYFDQPTPSHREPATMPTPPRPPAPIQPRQPAGRPRPDNILQKLIELPILVLQTGVQLIVSILGFGFNAFAFLGTRLLPAPVVNAVRGATRAITQGVEEVDAQVAAVEFVRSFQEQHGSQRPRFLECGWQEATAHAHREFKFLLVYLQSPRSQENERFCREVLCATEVVDFVNENFASWGGDVRYSDAYRLAASLRVTRFPYVGLLVFSGSRTRLCAAVEGPQTAAAVLMVLRRALEEHGPQLVAERADFEERDLNRRLRAEQDAEYERSLAADRERERLAEERRRAAAEAAAAQAAEEARIRAEQEAEAQRIADAAAALERRKAEKRAALKAEPAAGTPGTTSLRIRLPDSTNHTRRFMSSDTMQAVYDFVDSLDSLGSSKYSLASNFPRVVYKDGHLGQTLTELELAPQAALYVQPDDD